MAESKWPPHVPAPEPPPPPKAVLIRESLARMAELGPWDGQTYDPRLTKILQDLRALTEPEGQELCVVAERIGVKSGAIIQFLFAAGIFATLTQKLDYTTISLIEAHFRIMKTAAEERATDIRNHPESH